MKINREDIRRLVKKELGIISEGGCGCQPSNHDEPVEYDEPGDSMLSMLYDKVSDYDSHDDMSYSMDPHAGSLNIHNIDKETLGRYGNVRKKSMREVPCPGSYQKASNYLMQDPHMALSHSHNDIAHATDTHCPVSVCKAISDIVMALEDYIS